VRILFMGTPDFAAVSLQRLIAADFELSGVVTQPDRPKGRGLELKASEVKTVALEHDLPLWQPERVTEPDFMEIFNRINPDLVVVVAFGQKIPAEVLFGPKFGCINVHGSLLPRYRGAAPIQWSILNGDSQTGITTMYMDEGWDTGDIIYQQSIPIDPDENLAGLYARLAELGGELLVKTVADLKTGSAPRISQDHSLATKAPKLKPEQQIINWRNNALAIHNQVRVFAPAPGAETNFNQERLKIIETKLIKPPISAPNGEPGRIIWIAKNQGIFVSVGDGPILIHQIQPTGKRVMSAEEFSNGRRLKEGMFFGKQD
jgi:methionyl-tRNA formyltransferase